MNIFIFIPFMYFKEFISIEMTSDFEIEFYDLQGKIKLIFHRIKPRASALNHNL